MEARNEHEQQDPQKDYFYNARRTSSHYRNVSNNDQLQSKLKYTPNYQPSKSIAISDVSSSAKQDPRIAANSIEPNKHSVLISQKINMLK